MVRRQRTKQRAPFGRPKNITLLATADGWRYSVATEEGGTLCGRLADVPASADPAEARTAAEAMVTALAQDFHGANAEVTWGSAPERQSWTGEVTLATPPRS
ncbi:hypothetical protein AB0D84_27105 [Streptomyces sp. NPDC048193]|uniref:hypothetical protein n=1 Tax=unclassified Streptomyces TaxID=2593676 RepID=UPI003417404E